MEMPAQIMTWWAISLAIAIFAYAYSQPGGDPRLACALTRALFACGWAFPVGFLIAVLSSLIYMQFRLRYPLYLLDHRSVGRIVDITLNVLALLPVSSVVVSAIVVGSHAYLRYTHKPPAQPSGPANRS